METFVHRFADGQTCKIEFDLSKDTPTCTSDFKMCNQTKAVVKEYLLWRDSVVLPTVYNKLNGVQAFNMSVKGRNTFAP